MATLNSLASNGLRADSNRIAFRGNQYRVLRRTTIGNETARVRVGLAFVVESMVRVSAPAEAVSTSGIRPRLFRWDAVQSRERRPAPWNLIAAARLTVYNVVMVYPQRS